MTTRETQKETLEQAVASYMKELNTNSVVSRSHITLRQGRQRFGTQAFDDEVTRQLLVQHEARKSQK